MKFHEYKNRQLPTLSNRYQEYIFLKVSLTSQILRKYTCGAVNWFLPRSHSCTAMFALKIYCRDPFVAMYTKALQYFLRIWIAGSIYHIFS